MNATKLMVWRDPEFASPTFSLFKVEPENAHPLATCMVFLEHGEVTCGRHGKSGPCVEAVQQQVINA